MNNISDSNKMIDKIIQESMEKFRSVTVDRLQIAEKKFEYETYNKEIFSEKNT